MEDKLWLVTTFENQKVGFVIANSCSNACVNAMWLAQKTNLMPQPLIVTPLHHGKGKN